MKSTVKDEEKGGGSRACEVRSQAERETLEILESEGYCRGGEVVAEGRGVSELAAVK